MPDHTQPNPPTRPVPRIGTTTVRVRYNQCDPMGVVHHSHFVEWLELGRTELLRESGIAYAQLEREGILLAVVKLAITYKAPARYDDLLTITTTVTGGGRARIDHAYELHRDQDLIAVATSTLGCLDPTGRPRPLPDWLTPQRHA